MNKSHRTPKSYAPHDAPPLHRLTNGHSKSIKHHAAMRAIFFAFYNFCRKHEAIKQTPAMASGLTDKVWTIRELLERATG